MAPRRNRRRAPRRTNADRPARAPVDDPSIDALYGLDPPIGAHGTGIAGDGTGLQAAPLHCPYCGEPFETLVDLSAGSAAYIEDCPICCQPIELKVELDGLGALMAVSASRGA
jgi:hypothetical protein